MSSPGPTLTMLARKVRAGDVIWLDPLEPGLAVLAQRWVGPDVVMMLEDGTEVTAGLETAVDVHRPPYRLAHAGPGYA
jgi:hypothetical protein